MAFPTKAKYVIIGAGIHGLSTAWHLAEKIKKKIGIDVVEAKPEIVKEEVVESKTNKEDLAKEVKTETKKESSEEKK